MSSLKPRILFPAERLSAAEAPSPRSRRLSRPRKTRSPFRWARSLSLIRWRFLSFLFWARRFQLTEHQFGIWSAIAIHDTSSVVGAAAKFGDEALQAATTVKLARALWIAPVAMLTAWFFSEKSARFYIPLFILLFLLASVVRTYVPLPEAFYETPFSWQKKD